MPEHIRVRIVQNANPALRPTFTRDLEMDGSNSRERLRIRGDSQLLEFHCHDATPQATEIDCTINFKSTAYGYTCPLNPSTLCNTEINFGPVKPPGQVTPLDLSKFQPNTSYKYSVTIGGNPFDPEVQVDGNVSFFKDNFVQLGVALFAVFAFGAACVLALRLWSELKRR